MLPAYSFDLVNELDVSNLTVQSSDEPTDDFGDTTVTHNNEMTSEVLTFVDSSTGLIDNIPYNINPIVRASETSNTDLARFLSRPTKIDSRNWSTSENVGYFGATLEPWYQFLSNSVISNKLKNYAFIRGKLCIKVVINATPFHFGLVRVAYEPNVNGLDTGDRKSKIRDTPAGFGSLPALTPLSQLPGTWLYPSDNAGGEIHVPFFRFNNWLPLAGQAEAKTMGVLYYFIAAQLGVASSTASPSVTMDTYVWMEDVQLSGSTDTLTLQSKDEYDGVISQPASAIASVSSMLDSVPYIGPYARATTIGATAIAKVASIFGFTNVPVIDDVHTFVPTSTPHLASSEIGTPVQKLTLDPKQELSIDPSLHGLTSEDEMCISHLVQKESTLTTSSWSTSDSIGSVIFNAAVSPMMFSYVPIVNAGFVNQALRIYHTPMSYVGMLFEQWRGDIIFDIEVIGTKFHKGRLKIAWDPLGTGGTTALPENTVYTTILDIGETNKASIRVPFHQAYEFLNLRGISRNNWNVGGSVTTSGRFDNGIFIVSVLTRLMSPVTPQYLTVKVSARGAENLEFANPASHLGENSSTQPPSFFEVQSQDIVDTVSTHITFGDVGSRHENRYDLNIGERVVSLRTLLHRYSLYDTSFSLKTTATKFSSWGKSITRLPPMYGYDPNGQSTASKILAGSGTAPFNYVPTHPITYVSMMYGGFRGSVNYVINTSLDLFPYVGDIRVSRITDSSSAAYRQGSIISSSSTGATSSVTAQYLLNNLGPRTAGTAGASFTNSQTNGSINFNYPHMNIANFHYPDPTYSIPGNSADETGRECAFVSMLIKQSTANTSTDLMTMTTYAGTGPDFTCLWFLCCPTLDYYENTPVAQ
jgi:hypothetical protein